MTAAGRRVAAVVAAAGGGTRLGPAGGDVPKALVPLAGRPLLDLTLASLRAVAAVRQIVVVHPPGARAAFEEVVGEAAVLVVGGDTRQDSVRAGFDAVDPDNDLVAIHDAARPLTPPSVIERAIAAVTGEVVGAAPGLPVPDTLKRLAPDGDVVETLDRDAVWAVHTPQVLRRAAFRETVDWAVASGRHASDDLGLVEQALAAGVVTGRLRLVRGDSRDLKITYPEDVGVAAAMLRRSGPAGAS